MKSPSGHGPLAGRVALVTGAAGEIGSAVCRRLAGAGGHVVVTYRRNETEAQRLLADLPGEGHLLGQADVTDSTSLARLAQQVNETYGHLDVLVNNAGTTRYVAHDDLDALDDDLIDEIFRVNWRGAFAAARAFRPLLDASRSGVIINMSSVAGSTGQGSNVAYRRYDVLAGAGACASDKSSFSRARTRTGRLRLTTRRFVVTSSSGEYAAWAPCDSTRCGGSRLRRCC